MFDFIPDGEVVDFSSDVFPAILERRAASCYGHVVDGYWEDVGTLEAYRTAHEDILDGRVADRDRGLPAARAACGSARTPTSRPTSSIEGPVLIGDNCRIEAGRDAAPVHRARRRRRREGRRAPRAHASCTTTSTSGRRRACAARCIGRASDLRDGVRIEEGVVVGDECFIGAGRDHQPVGEDLPVQDGRAGRGRHVVDRVGEPRRAHAVRPARRARPRQRRHHLRGRGAPRDGVRHRAQEGLGRLHEPRHEPRRPGR